MVGKTVCRKLDDGSGTKRWFVGIVGEYLDSSAATDDYHYRIVYPPQQHQNGFDEETCTTDDINKGVTRWHIFIDKNHHDVEEWNGVWGL